MNPYGLRREIRRAWLVGTAALLLLSWLQKSSTAKQTIMPPIPQGIHLTYRSTSQRPALPPEWIEQRIANDMKTQHGASAEYFRSRAAAGPKVTDTAEYWGTMHELMYANAKSDCTAYDGKKIVSGTASYMVPELIRLPVAEHGGMVIAKGASPIEGRVPYLGIYQPNTELFADGVILSETVPLATGEKRVYHRLHAWGGGDAYALEYDREGRVRTMTISTIKRAFVRDKYWFADYATTGGISYPREVRWEHMTGWIGRDGKLAQAPEAIDVLRAVSASAGPIPNSFFALSTARPGGQIEDGRYQVPGKSEPGITYTYRNPALSIDEASERAYQAILSQTQPHGD